MLCNESDFYKEHHEGERKTFYCGIIKSQWRWIGSAEKNTDIKSPLLNLQQQRKTSGTLD